MQVDASKRSQLVEELKQALDASGIAGSSDE